MKVKITKNIIRDGTTSFGIRPIQIVIAILAVIVALITVFFLYDKMSIDLLMTIVFIEIAVTIPLGIVRVQGLSLLALVIQSIKGVDKRPYSSRGVFSNEQNQ